MNHYQDMMVAQSMAAERELQLRQRQRGAVRRRHSRRAAVAGQHPLRARLAHLWALSH